MLRGKKKSGVFELFPLVSKGCQQEASGPDLALEATIFMIHMFHNILMNMQKKILLHFNYERKRHIHTIFFYPKFLSVLIHPRSGNEKKI